MSGARTPSWGHNAVEMALSLGREFRKCMESKCGGWIIVAPAPNGSWIPLEQVGEVDDPDKPGNKFRVMAIHHDICTNARIPGNRDPARSHRIAKNEDAPVIADEQEQFEFHHSVYPSTEG